MQSIVRNRDGINSDDADVPQDADTLVESVQCR